MVIGRHDLIGGATALSVLPSVGLERPYRCDNGSGVVAFPGGGHANVRGRVAQASIMGALLYNFWVGWRRRTRAAE